METWFLLQSCTTHGICLAQLILRLLSCFCFVLYLDLCGLQAIAICLECELLCESAGRGIGDQSTKYDVVLQKTLKV